MSHYTVHLEGIPIRFPYEPYRCQLDYMRQVIIALKTSTHAALESPTGTGKTLCLLCASCAFVLWNRETNLPPVKILYTTRTHSQVTQVMSEFRRSGYAEHGIASCVLGSREQLCVHGTVKMLKGHALTAGCKNVRDNRTCRFFNHTASAPAHPPEKVMDIEDLMAEGATKPYCPYYFARENALPSADIIFCPYNYALDNTVTSHELKLSECVLIIDEGHNLPSVCLSTTSVEITTRDIAAAVADTARAMDSVQRTEESEKSENNTTTLQELAVLKKVWCNLERVLDQLPLEVHKETDSKVFLRQGDYVYEFLAQHNITKKTAELLIKHIERALEFVMTVAERSGFDGECRGLQTMLNFFNFLFPDGPDMKGSYHFVVQEGDQRGSGRSLCLWCLDCSVCMKRVEKKTRNIIVTSGTLSPLETFVQDLGIPFPNLLSGPHVISASQVHASVCCHGPSGDVLNSSYATRNSSEYKLSLGSCIVNLSRVVPDGMLVFFASYAAMNSALEAWKSAGSQLWDGILAHKQAFVEPKTAAESRDVVKAFQHAVDTGKGGVFFAVCRGKIAEGIDFADRHGRCVVVVGIPFASRSDLNVYLRKRHIDNNKKPTSTFTGDVWYRQDAIRAVNQALGRVIRHKADFGAVVLLDTRFTNNTKDISRWLQPYVVSCNEYMACHAGVAQFFASWKGSVVKPIIRSSVSTPTPPSVPPASAMLAARFSEEKDELLRSVALSQQQEIAMPGFAATVGGVGHAPQRQRVLHPHAIAARTPPPPPTTAVLVHRTITPRQGLQLFGSTTNPLELFLTKVRVHINPINYAIFKDLLKELKTPGISPELFRKACESLGEILTPELLCEMRDVVLPPSVRDAFHRAVTKKRQRE